MRYRDNHLARLELFVLDEAPDVFFVLALTHMALVKSLELTIAQLEAVDYMTPRAGSAALMAWDAHA